MRSGEGVYYEGPRRFLKISLGCEFLSLWSWDCFRMVAKVLEREGVLAEQLEHRYTEENFQGMVAVFEVVSRVRD